MIMKAVVTYNAWRKGNKLNMLCATIHNLANPEQILLTRSEKQA